MAGAIAAVALSTERGPDRDRAGARRRGLDAGGRAVQYRRAAFGAALGRRAARWRRSRPRSPAASRSEAGAGATSPTIAGVEAALLVSAGLMLLSPLLGIWLRMPPVGARNEDATEVLADPEVRLSLTGAQRAAGGRDRIPRRAGQRARLPQRDAGSAAQPAAQRRLWLVDRARHRRSRIVDRALPLPDLARLSAPAQPRRRSPSARCTSARSTFISAPTRSASAACWSGRSVRCAGRKIRPTAPPTRCCRGRDGGGQQHLIPDPSRSGREQLGADGRGDITPTPVRNLRNFVTHAVAAPGDRFN